MRLNDIPNLTPEEIEKAFFLYKYDGRVMNISTETGFVGVALTVTIPVMRQSDYDKRGHIMVLEARAHQGKMRIFVFNINQLNSETDVDLKVVDAVRSVIPSEQK
jgi:hypothetical protein